MAHERVVFHGTVLYVRHRAKCMRDWEDTMAELVEIACPRCGTGWWIDPAQIEGPVQVVYRSAERRGRVESYRVRCPKCGTHIVVDLEPEEEKHG